MASDKAVEAAARSLYPTEANWVALGARQILDEVRGALEAAEPLIRAEERERIKEALLSESAKDAALEAAEYEWTVRRCDFPTIAGLEAAVAVALPETPKPQEDR